LYKIVSKIERFIFIYFAYVCDLFCTEHLFRAKMGIYFAGVSFILHNYVIYLCCVCFIVSFCLSFFSFHWTNIYIYSTAQNLTKKYRALYMTYLWFFLFASEIHFFRFDETLLSRQNEKDEIFFVAIRNNWVLQMTVHRENFAYIVGTINNQNNCLDR